MITASEKNKIKHNLFDILFDTVTIIAQYVFFPNANEKIKDELFLHNRSISNKTVRDCTWRPINEKTVCPDPDVKYILYAKGKKEAVDITVTDWLRQSSWDPEKDDVLIVHGYAGGDDTLPIAVLRDGKE